MPNYLVNNPYTVKTFRNSPIMLIGDSHTWLAGAGGQYPYFDVDCMPGRESTNAVWNLAFDIQPRHKIIIFDIATNDSETPAKFRNDVETIVSTMLQNRIMLMVNSYKFWWGSNLAEAVNEQINQVVAAYSSKVFLIDWCTHATGQYSWLGSDLVHFNTEGYNQRTLKIVSDAIPYMQQYL